MFLKIYVCLLLIFNGFTFANENAQSATEAICTTEQKNLPYQFFYEHLNFHCKLKQGQNGNYITKKLKYDGIGLGIKLNIQGKAKLYCNNDIQNGRYYAGKAHMSGLALILGLGALVVGGMSGGVLGGGMPAVVATGTFAAFSNGVTTCSLYGVEWGGLGLAGISYGRFIVSDI